jgi:hypothetical protein
MLISEHIAFLQRQLEELGDVEFLKLDCEWGAAEFDHKPSEYRRVTLPEGTELISVEHYQLSHQNIQQHNESFTALEDLIEEAKHNPASVNALFGDPDEVMKFYMIGYHRDLAIVKAWHESPRVLVL